MGSFATKYVNEDLLKFNPQGKVRIRFSLMPEELRLKLEPNTSYIYHRLSAVRKFQDAGYDVHLNFSPVVVYPGWLSDYRDLFVEINAFNTVHNWNKTVKAEVIFLTHNIDKHVYNVTHDIPGENLLWRPEIQEKKTSQYGGVNLRYNRYVKPQYIKEFTEAFNAALPWMTIRYIF
jgi:spore photoproduct lyase